MNELDIALYCGLLDISVKYLMRSYSKASMCVRFVGLLSLASTRNFRALMLFAIMNYDKGIQ